MKKFQNFEHLKQSLLKAWPKETSYDPAGWSADNPSYGQCAVTACVVQDHFGGDILGTNAILPDGTTALHFLNDIDGQEKDMTRDQFPAGTTIPPGKPMTEGHPTTRDMILSYESTRKRYDLLRRAIKI